MKNLITTLCLLTFLALPAAGQETDTGTDTDPATDWHMDIGSNDWRINIGTDTGTEPCDIGKIYYHADANEYLVCGESGELLVLSCLGESPVLIKVTQEIQDDSCNDWPSTPVRQPDGSYELRHSMVRTAKGCPNKTLSRYEVWTALPECDGEFMFGGEWSENKE